VLRGWQPGATPHWTQVKVKAKPCATLWPHACSGWVIYKTVDCLQHLTMFGLLLHMHLHALLAGCVLWGMKSICCQV
jgi:hypothetical protein